jgi:serine/threonine-protein kinase RsbW
MMNRPQEHSDKRSDVGGPVPDAGDAGVHCELSIPSDPARLRQVRHAVERMCAAAGFDEKSIGEVGLCVNEALANIMRHAYRGATDRPIVVQAEVVDPEVRISIRDWGLKFDPATVMYRSYDPEQPGGLGLICLRQCMDDVEYLPQDQGMLLKMRRRRR